MFQKSTNTLLGWVVEKIGGIPGTVAPSFGSKKEQVTARHQYIIPDVAEEHPLVFVADAVRYSSTGSWGKIPATAGRSQE